LESGEVLTDTILYTIPEFRFLNQDSAVISTDDYRGHVYVADFFFSNCPTICPVMTSQLARLQDKLANRDLLGEVKLISHTVDPARDIPSVLSAYANQIEADTRYWNFVWGSREELYTQAQNGYLVTAFESDTAAGGFFHTDQFVLLDRELHIRGYYDGTSTQQVDILFEDILKLLKESSP
jgi:protein SCO1/2